MDRGLQHLLEIAGGLGVPRHGSQAELVAALVEEGCLATAENVKAFAAVDRGHFLPEGTRPAACYVDAPVRDGRLHQSAPSVYARALELAPGLSFLNLGSGTGYFSAIVAQIIGPRAMNVGVERHMSNVEHAREKCLAIDLPEIQFVCGNCFNISIDQSMKFDRVYVGAGAGPDAKFLYKLLKYDGLIVGPFEDEDGVQGLSKARCRGGTKFAVTRMMQVRFADLIRPSNAEPVACDAEAVVLQGPNWETSRWSDFSPAFQRTVVLLYWMNQIEGSLPNMLPWEIWTKYVISLLGFDAFDAPAAPGAARGCAACGATGSALQCGRCKAVHYCGRECQKRDWKNHKESCVPLSQLAASRRC